MNIWETLPEHFMCLAPMEGVTDVVFRAVIARAGRPDLFFTEFTNVSSFASEKGRHDALERLSVSETDAPIIAQIWGKNPEHFAGLASELESLGFQGLDINMGCPDKHVVKAGGGSNMIRTPELAVECIREAKAHTSLPVSVKTRLGFTYADEYKTWLPLLLQQNLAALTVHLRTRKEMSKVAAHYELIPEIVKLRNEIAPQTKLIINGDIADRNVAEKLWAENPEVDGMMIGRGVFANPYCFTGRVASGADGKITSSGAEEIASDKKSAPVSKEELLELFRYHLDKFDEHAVEIEAKNAAEPDEKLHSRYPYEPLKRMFKLYIHSFDGASDLRVKLMECKNTAELRETLDNWTSENAE